MFTVLSDFMSNGEIMNYLKKYDGIVAEDDTIMCLYDNDYAIVNIHDFIKVYNFGNRQVKNGVFQTDYEGHDVVTIMTSTVKKKIAELIA